ncbi:MAG: galactose-1-phosphate uridylyltransferase [bacterium]
MPTLRKDPIAQRWVIIATDRAKRPRDYSVAHAPLTQAFCPFCAGHESATPPAISQHPSGGDWQVRVIPNKYPALKIEGEIRKRGNGVYDEMSGIGAHEVIIESPEHLLHVSDLSVDQIATVLSTWQERMRDLRNDQRLKCAIVFKNHGAQAGASLEHVHSQLIALPIIPKRLAESLDGARKYYEFRDRCVFCDILDQEQADQERIVFQNEDIVAFCPFAARFPFELWILPRRHEPWYENVAHSEVNRVAEALKICIDKLNRALDFPPFNLLLRSAPFVHADHPHYHWHIEIIPTLTRVAGFEWGTGFYINPTPPEDAARHLRDID